MSYTSTGADVVPVRIPSAHELLDADLAVPAELHGVVIFAHGSGSSRHSSRNRYVADSLQRAGFATVLLDLLTREEEAIDLRTRELRFDIGMLARRVADAIDWAATENRLADKPIGLFGASTGAAAAIIAAAERPQCVHAVVSRGGRPDLAGDALGRVQAPTLLIVGGLDGPVIGMNEEAAARMHAEHELVVVPGASHLFVEPGKLEEVAALARDWFARRLAG
jgi:putative phosphoribosyl transferase